MSKGVFVLFMLEWVERYVGVVCVGISQEVRVSWSVLFVLECVERCVGCVCVGMRGKVRGFCLCWSV